TIYNGSLIAAARVKLNGSSIVPAVLRWNGNGWEMLGNHFGFSPGSVVNALTVYQGQLFAGGTFSSFSNTEYVARWNGTTWQPNGPSVPATVNAMATFDLDGAGPNGPSLIIAGGTTFPFAFAFNGSAWTSLMHTSLDCEATDMCEFNGKLYIC